MAKNRKGNSSSIGTATHTIKQYVYGSNPSTRKSRYKCIYYETETRECSVMRILCVGPSNAFCKDYCEKRKRKDSIKISVGDIVFEKNLGIGVIERKLDVTFYVRFVKSNSIRSFFTKEIKKIENNIIYI
jgi:hypothetical protein